MCILGICAFYNTFVIELEMWNLQLCVLVLHFPVDFKPLRKKKVKDKGRRQIKTRSEFEGPLHKI